MRNKEAIAMLLAGGRGSRLKQLTEGIAKPAVYFGGKYRIIDFPLSNCTNSGIDTVGVLTQYEPFVLNAYIGNGTSWDLDVKDGGVFLLPPYVDEEGGNWYTGTAGAIYSNISFIETFDPEHVVILSGDHIYKMDYSRMLNYHKEKEADVTISVYPVDWGDANRFGIMKTNEEDQITNFFEKPEDPVSNLASMGIYIFRWPVLREALIRDKENRHSSNDFGKNIIPLLLEEDSRIYAYSFSSYWKDVGTVYSYWEAHMDLLSEEPELNLNDPGWHIYSRNPNLPPHFIAPEAKITDSLINEGCIVRGKVEHSVLHFNVNVGRNSLVSESVILPGVEIGENVSINRAVIGEDTVIEDGVKLGKAGSERITLVGNNKRISVKQGGE